MSALSALSMLACALYLDTGLRALSLDRGARINRIAFALAATLSAWAFCFVFVYAAPSSPSVKPWLLIVAAAWHLFVCQGLHFCLLIAKPERRLGYLGNIAIYLPGFALAAISLAGIFGSPAPRGLFSEGGSYALIMAVVQTLFFLAYFSAGVLAILTARRKTRDFFERKRLGLLLVSIAVPTLLGFLTDSLAPVLGLSLPRLGILWCVIWAVGLRVDMDRYGFIAPFRKTADAGRLFSAFLEKSQDGITVSDADGRIAIWNLAMESISGAKATEVLGRPLWEVQAEMSAADAGHGYDADVLKAMAREALSDGGQTWDPRVTEYAIYDRGKELHWLQSSAFVITLSGGRRCLAAIVRDVTSERKAALAAREERKRLEKAEKMEAIGNLAAGLAHDFNNILMGIKGTVAVLRLGVAEGTPPSSSELTEGLDLIEGSSARGSELVRQLLSLARKMPLERRPVKLAEAVDHVTRIMRNSLDDCVSIVVEPVPEDAVVMAEGAQVERVLLNLLINAADAMTGMRNSAETKGGHIYLSVRLGTANEGMMARRPGAASRFWVISVRDEGVGIDEADMARVFDPFFTTKSDGKSHGLGLPTVYAIAESHGGFAEAKSNRGVGSEFLVHFPVAEPSSDPSF